MQNQQSVRGRRSPAVSRYLAIALAGLAGLAGACGDTTGPIGMADPSRSDTDVPQFEVRRGDLGWEATIPFVFTNTSDGSVFLDNCNGWTGADFEQLVDGEWVYAVGVGRPDCLGVPIEVPAAGTWETGIPFFAAYPDNEVDPKLAVDGVEGRYRIVLHGVYSRRPPSSFDEVPGWIYGPDSPYWVAKERRVSGAFELVEHA